MKNLSVEIELKNFKSFNGHDGAPAFNADLFINKRCIASIYDDARGGEFEYRCYGDINSQHREETKLAFDKLEKEITKLQYKCEFGGGMVNHSMDTYIGELTEVCLRKKDEKKGILIKSQSGYQISGAKVSIPTFLKKYKNGLEVLQTWVNECINDGDEILNIDYLKSVGVKFA